MPNDSDINELTNLNVPNGGLNTDEIENVVTEENFTEEDYDKKNYVEITPTFYVQPVMDEDSEENLFMILNPETGTLEKRELTESEEHLIMVRELKLSKQKFNPLRRPTKVVGYETKTNFMGITTKEKVREVQTNVIENKFGSKYKAKRNRRKKLTRASRKANRR